MPEGDTILRAASAVGRWIGGREITAVRSQVSGVHRLVGDTVAGVEARGKHMLIHFASGRVLHTHMRMQGSWHLYATGARWQRPGSQARVVLEAGDRTAVCFLAPVVELLVPGGAERHPALVALGPDVLAIPLDLAEIGRRLDAQPPSSEIGDVLLDQRVVAGIGNIWRCETLWLNHVHPRAPLATVAADRRVALVQDAARLMGAAVGGGRAAGAAGGAAGGVAGGVVSGSGRPPMNVYGRTRRACRRCGDQIVSARVGQQRRTAYWCPRCQPAPAPA